MTIAAIAAQLLTYFSPEERNVPDSATYPGRNAAVALAMNGALQELYGNASPWVRFDDRGVLINAPTTVTLAVTQGSTAATVTGWADWMAGCSIIISGSAIDNRIRNDSANAVLKYPCDVATGNVSATVYHDCITLDTDLMEVVKPVRLDRMPLSPIVSGDAPVFTSEASEEDYGFHRRTVPTVAPARVVDVLGTPLGYAVETWSKDAASAPRTRLLLKPAPAGQHHLDYKAMLAPPVVITDLAATAFLPVPLQWIQSIFFPMARQRLSGSPFYRPDAAQVEEIARAHGEALRLLDSLNPRKNAGTKLSSRY
jgi:hypothetical protein